MSDIHKYQCFIEELLDASFEDGLVSTKEKSIEDWSDIFLFIMGEDTLESLAYSRNMSKPKVTNEEYESVDRAAFQMGQQLVDNTSMDMKDLSRFTAIYKRKWFSSISEFPIIQFEYTTPNSQQSIEVQNYLGRFFEADDSLKSSALVTDRFANEAQDFEILSKSQQLGKVMLWVDLHQKHINESFNASFDSFMKQISVHPTLRLEIELAIRTETPDFFTMPLWAYRSGTMH